VALLAFPLIVVIFGLVLGFAGISGSSVALHGEAAGGSGPLVGRARPIRFDEFYVRTPFVVRQAALGFPKSDEVGVGRHDMGVLAHLPVRGWQNALRPHEVPYQVFGLETAFALEWWLVQLILPAIGIYALALACRLRVVTAALVALIFVFSPAMQWLTATGLGEIVGYGCLAAALLVFAARMRTWWARIGLAVVAGWLGACFFAVIYPPWQIPIALVAGSAAAATIARDLDPRAPGRALLHAVLPVCVVAAAVGGLLVLAFVGAHRDAFSAISNSAYPGRRRRSGGAGSFRLLFDAPFDAIQSLNPRVVLAVNGNNQSEASGGLVTLFAVGAALLADPVRAFRGAWRERVAVVALLGFSAVLLAWCLLPIPAAAGRVLLLDFVPSYRLMPPLALASALALGLYTAARARWRPRLRWWSPLVGTAVFAAGTVWAAATYSIDGHIASWQLIALGVAFTLGVALTLWWGNVGLVVLVVLLGLAAVTVNPLQHGLGPLLDSPGAQLGRALRDRPHTGAVVFFANDPRGDIRALSAMTSSGVRDPSALDLYPVPRAWRRLDSDRSDTRNWNRYANALWGVAPEGSPPRVFLNTKDSVIVMVDPCKGSLGRLGVRTVVSFVPLDRWCLVPQDVVPNGMGSLFVYRIDRSRPHPAP
jgi:hypothetical protein